MRPWIRKHRIAAFSLAVTGFRGYRSHSRLLLLHLLLHPELGERGSSKLSAELAWSACVLYVSFITPPCG